MSVYFQVAANITQLYKTVTLSNLILPGIFRVQQMLETTP